MVQLTINALRTWLVAIALVVCPLPVLFMRWLSVDARESLTAIAILTLLALCGFVIAYRLQLDGETIESSRFASRLTFAQPAWARQAKYGSRWSVLPMIALSLLLALGPALVVWAVTGHLRRDVLTPGVFGLFVIPLLASDQVLRRLLNGWVSLSPDRVISLEGRLRGGCHWRIARDDRGRRWLHVQHISGSMSLGIPDEVSDQAITAALTRTADEPLLGRVAEPAWRLWRDGRHPGIAGGVQPAV